MHGGLAPASTPSPHDTARFSFALGFFISCPQRVHADIPPFGAACSLSCFLYFLGDSIVSIARKEPRLDKNITMCNGLDKKPSEILPWERLLSADLACPLQRKTQTKFAECATTLVKRADA